MVAADMLRRYPDETISAFLIREPWTDPVYRAGQNREITGMRLAGIPDYEGRRATPRPSALGHSLNPAPVPDNVRYASNSGQTRVRLDCPLGVKR